MMSRYHIMQQIVNHCQWGTRNARPSSWPIVFQFHTVVGEKITKIMIWCPTPLGLLCRIPRLINSGSAICHTGLLYSKWSKCFFWQIDVDFSRK